MRWSLSMESLTADVATSISSRSMPCREARERAKCTFSSKVFQRLAPFSEDEAVHDLASACPFCIQSALQFIPRFSAPWKESALEKVATHGTGAHEHAHVHEHHELAFWQKYIFSQDHKVIGIQYAVTGLLFLLFGFTLMMIMRWQLAYPGRPIPLIGALLGAAKAPGGIMLPEFYNQLGAMHGTIMVFLGVVPLAVGGFGNFVMPLQIGAPDMAFPKLNMVSYWVYFIGGVTMLASFFVMGGAAQSGWTSYPPLSDISIGNAQTL